MIKSKPSTDRLSRRLAAPFVASPRAATSHVSGLTPSAVALAAHVLGLMLGLR